MVSYVAGKEAHLKKAIVIVLDGVGIGEMPDADLYGDCGSNTLGNTAEAVGGLSLPSLQKMGLGNIYPVKGVEQESAPSACWGKMSEASAGKDSTTGHWEMMGLVSHIPMPTFPDGFPEEIVSEFSRLTGRTILGNEVASGTEIVSRLGKLQMDTAGLIVYTSADSVFQIAAHEDVIPVEKLYQYCTMAREMLQPPDLGVGRVIARPFTGSAGDFTRTSRRKDFSLEPPGNTLIDSLAEASIPVNGVGKIDDLFCHRNISTTHAGSNREEMAILENMVKGSAGGFIFANLCDFDMKWGHRNDFRGFARGLEEFDSWLPSFTSILNPGDLLLITADHGNDPTTPSTDHSREFVPLLAYTPESSGFGIGIRKTFSDIACTLCNFFGIGNSFPGEAIQWREP